MVSYAACSWTILTRTDIPALKDQNIYITIYNAHLSYMQ